MQGENNKRTGEEARKHATVIKRAKVKAQNFGHMTRVSFLNKQKNANKSTTSTYVDTINQFAITLHFYSLRAYKFVRRSLHLPCPSTI